MRAVVLDRLAWVERKMLGGVPDAHIDREGAARFNLTQGQLGRYRRHVLRRWPDFSDEQARANYFKSIIARSASAALRCRRNERVARRSGDIAAATGALRTEVWIYERQMEWLALGAPKRVEISNADPVKKMSQAERNERALRHARRMTEASLADVKPEGNA